MECIKHIVSSPNIEANSKHIPNKKDSTKLQEKVAKKGCKKVINIFIYLLIFSINILLSLKSSTISKK